MHGVVRESTVCLMGHERRQTLALIDALACRELCARAPLMYAPHLQMQQMQAVQAVQPVQHYYVCVCAACAPVCAACVAYCECCRPRACPA